MEEEVIIPEDKIEKAREFLRELAMNEKEPLVSFATEDHIEVIPGSVEAQIAGCKCDPEANSFGEGLYAGTKNWQGKRMFVLDCECSVHGDK